MNAYTHSYTDNQARAHTWFHACLVVVVIIVVTVFVAVVLVLFVVFAV